MKPYRKFLALGLCIVLAASSLYQQNVLAGIPSEILGITDETGSAVTDNTVGIGSGAIGDKGLEIAEAGIKAVPGSSWYTKLGTVSKIIKWGGFTIGTIDTVRDSYTLIMDNSKHTTLIGRATDKGLALVGVAMGWAAAIGTVAAIGATAPVTGTVAVVTGTGFALAAAGVAITKGVVNTDAVRIVENILSGNRKGVGFAPFETPGFRENRQVVKEMLGFDPYDHSDNEIPDPNTGIPVYKPNIYLYSEEAADATIHIYPPSQITASIPAYLEGPGWTAHVFRGSLNGSEDFLFYEAVVPDTSFQKERGWMVRKGHAAYDLNVLLDEYAFNAKEKADFLEFWSGMLQENQDFVAYPQETAIVNQVMPIRVEPSPEHLTRIWFYFLPMESSVRPEPPESITPIDHTGFSVVEWGGLIGE